MGGDDSNSSREVRQRLPVSGGVEVQDADKLAVRRLIERGVRCVQLDSGGCHLEETLVICWGEWLAASEEETERLGGGVSRRSLGMR